MINKIIHNINYCVFNSTITFFYINYKKYIINKPYDTNIVNELRKNWNKINIYEKAQTTGNDFYSPSPIYEYPNKIIKNIMSYIKTY
jgi:hypothetical protein